MAIANNTNTNRSMSWRYTPDIQPDKHCCSEP